MLQTQSSRFFKGLYGKSVHTRLGIREHSHLFASNFILAQNSQPGLIVFDIAHARSIKTIVINDNQL